ncbi:hypothetical protein EV291_12981 [Rhizobium sp. BK068]|nr:hypothetical protein EV291_12981 [Rhizobium sp. BK068]
MELHFWLARDEALCEATPVYLRGGRIAALHAKYQGKRVAHLARLRDGRGAWKNPISTIGTATCCGLGAYPSADRSAPAKEGAHRDRQPAEHHGKSARGRRHRKQAETRIAQSDEIAGKQKRASAYKYAGKPGGP